MLAQLAAAFEHFNEVHPHSSLKMRSPREFRRHRSTGLVSVPRDYQLVPDSLVDVARAANFGQHAAKGQFRRCRRCGRVRTAFIRRGARDARNRDEMIGSKTRLSATSCVRRSDAFSRTEVGGMIRHVQENMGTQTDLMAREARSADRPGVFAYLEER